MTESQAPVAASTSKLAMIACVIGLIGSALPIIGIGGIQLGALSPMFGFSLFGAGCILGGGLALLLGIAALIATRGGSDPQGRKLGLAAVVLAVGLLLMLGVAGSSSSGLPPINDITTNLEDPPRFAGDPAGRDRDMSYPADWKPLVRESYADLQTVASPLAPAAALAHAREVGKTLGWQERSFDVASGQYEASEATPIFRFIDDVVVRVRPAAGGSLIDVRSKSRDGRGDLGANAARIRSFLDAL